jgi:hypothetical protein
MSQARAKQWLDELEYLPEQAPDWVLRGTRPDYFCAGASPLWTQSASFDDGPALHDRKQAWRDFPERCDAARGLDGALHAMVGANGDAQAALWLLRHLNDDLRDQRAHARHASTGSAVFAVPGDPDYGVTVHFVYQSRHGSVSQVGPRARSGRYPWFPTLEPSRWGAPVAVAGSDGTATTVEPYDLLCPEREGKLVARWSATGTALQVHAARDPEACRSESIWRLRDIIESANARLHNGQQYAPAPSACVVYDDGPDRLSETALLATLFGDLTIPYARDPTRHWVPFHGRNGAFTPTRNRAVSLFRYVWGQGGVTTVENPWAEHPVDWRTFREPVWMLKGNRATRRT